MKRFFPFLFLLFVFSCEDKEVIPPFEGDISLNIYEIKYFSEEVEIGFLDVNEDSRCPKGVVCKWPGNGKISLRLSINSSINYFTLNFYLEPTAVELSGYMVELKELNPYPVYPDKISLNDYSIILNVEQID